MNFDANFDDICQIGRNANFDICQIGVTATNLK